MQASNARVSHAKNSPKTSPKTSRESWQPTHPARGKAATIPGQGFSRRKRQGAGGQAHNQDHAGLTFSGQDWFSPILNGNRRICANCRHWDLHYKACLPRLEHGQLHFDIAAPCAVGAVTTNAGDCVPMLGETGSCAGHADLFAPSDDYLQELLAESEIAELLALRDRPINFDDIPELDKSFFKNAVRNPF